MFSRLLILLFQFLSRPVFKSDPLQPSCSLNDRETEKDTESDENLGPITKKCDEPSPSSSWKPKLRLWKGAFLAQAFVKSVTPGLVSLAQPSTDVPDLQVVVEEPETTDNMQDEEEDEDVVAMIADF